MNDQLKSENHDLEALVERQAQGEQVQVPTEDASPPNDELDPRVTKGIVWGDHNGAGANSIVWGD